MMTSKQVDEIRSRFRIFQRKIYLNSCSQGALSDAVESGMEEFIASWHDQGSPWELWVQRYEEARTAFAKFIHASADEVAVVTSASAGINSVASALKFQDRKKVVLGEFEFPTMGHIWLAQQVRGAELHFVRAVGNSIPAGEYEELIDADTCIVPLTHVCFKNGFRSEVAAITKIAHRSGALVMLDDYQDCGTRPIDVKAMDLDFYVSGTLKYLLGPPGVAFLYVRPELIPVFTPTLTGWFAQKNPFAYDPQTIDLSLTARRFESGTPSVPNLYAAVPGFEMLREIGMENVAEHIKNLAQTLLKNALDLGIQTKTPNDSVGPLVVLRANDSTLLVQKLAEKGIVASNRHDGLRISFHVYNTMEDVEAVVAALEEDINLLVCDAASVGSHD